MEAVKKGSYMNMIVKGLGLAIIIALGMFLANMVQERRMLNAIKRKAETDAAAGGVVGGVPGAGTGGVLTQNHQGLSRSR